MATRFAGDFFGVPLVAGGSNAASKLFDYFSDLRTVKKPSAPAPRNQATMAGGARAVSPFVGHKTLASQGQVKATPVFTGFKTQQQPARPRPSATGGTKPATGKTTYSSVAPDVVKALGL